jgi:hypothetical protein
VAVELIDGRGYSLRHVHPTATYASEGGTATVLGRTYGFTWLHQAHIPTDHGFVEGTYTTRLGDSGEFSVTFPNSVGALGPWRERFSGDLALEFIEIYRDEVLEFVGCIQRVEIDRGSVTVSGPDGWALLRRAYERDRSWTAAPQEVANAYTRVPVAIIADDFDSLAAWTVTGSSSVANSEATIWDVGGGLASITQSAGSLGDSWRARATVRAVSPSDVDEIFVGVAAGVSVSYYVSIGTGLWSFYDTVDGTVITQRTRSIDRTVPVTVEIVRLGRWIGASVQGNFIGFLEVKSGFTGTITFDATVITTATAGQMVVSDASLVELQDFLARGSDLGDYVLPGDMPTGGLRGRYFNDADLQGYASADRKTRILAPDREPYAERLDASMNSASGLSIPIQPGNSGDYFSVRWFGSVYLRGDLGNYTFETTSIDDGVRVWVGKTGWGDQIIDDWNAAAGTDTGTWTAANYGSQAGWYPIVVEFFEDAGSQVFRLQFTPPASTYTDPGGTSITASTKITVPSTSLSPLGCYDNRVQGSAHFELVQGAAQAFGYDITLEPQSLESGEFPGRLVPRVRVGDDTDVILEPEDTDAAEPALNPGVTFDASDQTVNLIGTGAGIADGRGSQTTGEVADLALIDTGLFALEAWVDAGDIAFDDLLAARLNAELALRGTEWEEVRATPRAQERRADTWPLSGTHSAMMWRVGDGVRLRVPDIAVEDTEPRQIIQVTRTFNPEGRTGTQVAFRQRPRSQAKTVRGHLRSALALGRSYQRQKVTLISPYIEQTITAAGGFSSTANIPLLPGDKVVRAYVRIVVNTNSQSLGLEVNSVDVTSLLGGGWSTVPVNIDITGYATQASTTNNRLSIRIENNGGSDSVVHGQVFCEVLR